MIFTSIKRQHHSRGFTITEMSFAMTGLSILMVVLIVSIMGIASVYNRGLNLRAANQSGKIIGEDVQRMLRQAPSSSVMQGIDNGIVTRICTGKVSYIWSVQSSTPSLVRSYLYSNNTPIRFARVLDQGKVLCTDTIPSGRPILSKSGANFSAVEMLDSTLAIRYSAVDGGSGIDFVGPSDGLSVFTYTIASSSATNEEFIADGSRCEGGKVGEFCALNTFTITSYSRYDGS